MVDVALIRSRFADLSPHLDERGRRLLAASEARAAGHGGIVAVWRATGIAPSTIGRGLRELDAAAPGWVRRAGGGRKTLVASDPGLLPALLALVRPTERGDPMSPLRRTCLSLRHLADALVKQGHRVSHTVVGVLPKAEGFSLQANSKTLEGGSHPDRGAQFAHISQGVSAALAGCEPVVSVDTKKEELVGPFRNPGREWRPQGTPEQVRMHDFLIEGLGRAVPYGVHDLAANAGWVSVGVDGDTAAFAVQTIRRWWQEVGRARYPAATRLAVTADGGGSSGLRVRLWRRELQRLADELGIEVTAHHHRVAIPRREMPQSGIKAAGHQQVEQDRAPPVLVHQPELAGEAAGRLPRHREPDRRRHHPGGPRGQVRTGRKALPQGCPRVRRGHGRAQHPPRPVPWRLELHHKTTARRGCFMTGHSTTLPSLGAYVAGAWFVFWM